MHLGQQLGVLLQARCQELHYVGRGHGRDGRLCSVAILGAGRQHLRRGDLGLRRLLLLVLKKRRQAGDQVIFGSRGIQSSGIQFGAEEIGGEGVKGDWSCLVPLDHGEGVGDGGQDGEVGLPKV